MKAKNRPRIAAVSISIFWEFENICQAVVHLSGYLNFVTGVVCRRSVSKPRKRVQQNKLYSYFLFFKLLCLARKATSARAGFNADSQSRSNLNLEMLVFESEGHRIKPLRTRQEMTVSRNHPSTLVGVERFPIPVPKWYDFWEVFSGIHHFMLLLALSIHC